MEEFSSKRITQSDYRGGSSKGHRDKSDGRMQLDLQPLGIADSEKKAFRVFIAQKAELLIGSLLPEQKQKTVRESDYLESIFEKLDI